MGEQNITRLYGPVVELGTWGIRINEELRELYKDLDVGEYLDLGGTR